MTCLCMEKLQSRNRTEIVVARMHKFTPVYGAAQAKEIFNPDIVGIGPANTATS